MLRKTLACFFFTIAALAMPLVPRVVFNPRITSPKQGTVWVVNEIETVTWDTSDLPPDSELTTPFGKVILGFVTEGSDSLHLDLDDPLAENFKLSAGEVDVTVPKVNTGTNYIIVLMGDSGNASPQFVIEGSAVIPPSSSPTSSSTSTSEGETVTGSATTSRSVTTATSTVLSAQTSTSVTTTPTSMASITSLTSTTFLASPSSMPLALSSQSSASSSALEGSSAAQTTQSSNGGWRAIPSVLNMLWMVPAFLPLMSIL